MSIEAMELVFELRELADKFSDGWHNGIKIDASDIMLLSQSASFIETIAEAEKEERNFCPRCGKRIKDIHTCTPPKGKA